MPLEKRAEEAEPRTEGAKEETTALEWAMLDGQVALLGEVEPGRLDDQEGEDLVECRIQRDGGPRQDPKRGARADRGGRND